MSRYNVKRTVVFDQAEVSCCLCKKVCKGQRSLNSHFTQMHTGVKDTSHRGKPKGAKAWNKGLTITDPRVAKGVETYFRRLAAGEISPAFKGRKHSGETRNKISLSQAGNNRGGRCKWFEVNGIKVQGTWERDFAIKLSEFGIKWQKVKSFTEQYVDDQGVTRRYTPDFYLEDFDIFIELKGYWWGNDKRKMEIILSSTKSKIIVIEKDEYKRFIQGELVWSFQRQIENL